MGVNQLEFGLTEFEIFWKNYPRKVAKGDARKAWKQTASIRPTLQELLEKLREQCNSDQWRKENGQYIPYMSTYLRAERWDDEMEIALPKPEKVRDRFDLANERFAAAQAQITPEERARVKERFAALGKAIP